MESSDLGEGLAIYFQNMALRQQLEGQQPHMLPSEIALPFDAAMLNAEQDVENNIDQEIQHLIQIKQQLQKRQQHRQQQAQLLLAQQPNQPRLSPVTSGFTEQSFGTQQSSASSGWSTDDAATAARYSTNPPRHSIDLGSLASMSALGQGPPRNGGCFNSNGFNSSSGINNSQQDQSPFAGQFAGQVGGAAVACRRPAGLPRSPLPSSNNLAAAASLDAAGGVNNNVLLSAGANLQRLQLEQSNGMLGLSAGVLNSSSINCSTPIISQELSPLYPQQQQLYLQSALYASGTAEAPGIAPAQSPAPGVFGAVSNPNCEFSAHGQAVQLSDIVPDFSYTQQQQPSSFMTAQPGLAASADGAFGTSSNMYGSFDLGVTALTADAQGIMGSQNSPPNNPAGFGGIALLQQQQLQQQQYPCRHSVDVPAFSSVGGMRGGYHGFDHQAGPQVPAQPQDNSLRVTGSSQSFTAVSTRTVPMAQVASSSGSFTAGCGRNMQCSMSCAQAMGGQSMHSMGPKGDLGMTDWNGPVAAAVHDARAQAVTGQLHNTRDSGSGRASIDIGAYSRSRFGPGGSSSTHVPAAAAAAAGRGGTPGVPPFSTPPATPAAGSAVNNMALPWSGNGMPPTPSPKHHNGHGAAAACASALSDRTSRRNSGSSDASGTSSSSSSGKLDGPVAAEQQLMSAAPKWAGSFWHPLTDVVKRGPAAAKKGTGVFIPPGMKNLL